MNMASIECIYPDWPAPVQVRALTTTRVNGFSQGCYAGLNLASHVKDKPSDVKKNRQLLTEQLGLPAEPVWLEQVHGVNVVNGATVQSPVVADAAFVTEPGVVCAVLTADCLPVFICNRKGTKVAVAHAGWRGLQAGVVEATIEHMREPPADLLVWLGPAIGPDTFEVGEEVRQDFISELPEMQQAFTSTRAGHYLADLYQLAHMRLNLLGINSVSGGNLCTYSDKQRFYSYRRDGDTGRMASLIWMEA